MKKISLPKIQHYVPRFILKRFAITDTSQLYVFDKYEEKEYKANIIKIAAENGFYNLNRLNVQLSIELSLDKFETKASKIINRIVNERNLSFLSENDKRFLSLFFSIQRLRVPSFRKMVSEVVDIYEDYPSEIPKNQSGFNIFDEIKEEYIKELAISLVIDAEEQAAYFYNKTWILYQTTNETPFLISDNPIVLQNILSPSQRGKLGVGVKGIEIYMPISSTLALAFTCKSYEKKMRQLHQNFSSYKKIIPSLAKNLDDELEYYNNMLNSINNGVPFDFSRDSVVNINSLQIRFSNRFVYSSNGDFNLLKEMIKDDPSFKRPKCIKNT